MVLEDYKICLNGFFLGEYRYVQTDSMRKMCFWNIMACSHEPENEPKRSPLSELMLKHIQIYKSVRPSLYT